MEMFSSRPERITLGHTRHFLVLFYTCGFMSDLLLELREMEVCCHLLPLVKPVRTRVSLGAVWGRRVPQVCQPSSGAEETRAWGSQQPLSMGGILCFFKLRSWNCHLELEKRVPDPVKLRVALILNSVRTAETTGSRRWLSMAALRKMWAPGEYRALEAIPENPAAGLPGALCSRRAPAQPL